jgi:hypothetical protein
MPWETKILYPVEKWLPVNVSPASDPKAATPSDPAWQVITTPNEPAKPPVGLPVYWWLHPKADWPYATPWAKKQFGTFPPMQTWMWEHHTDHFPPGGIIKTHMAGQKVVEATERISFQNIKMHMRHLSPDEVKLKIAVTPFGKRYYAQGKSWDKYNGSSEYVPVKSPIKEPT